MVTLVLHLLQVQESPGQVANLLLVSIPNLVATVRERGRLMDTTTEYSQPTYIAHIRAGDGQIQTVSEHLKAVQAGCEAYGAKIGVSHLAGLAGLLHDLGKNTSAFKDYISQAVANPDNPPRRGSVDHSTAGGRFLYRRFYTRDKRANLAVEWVSNCIISHHQGLRDYLDAELKSPFLERVALKQEGMGNYEEAEGALWQAWSASEMDCYFEAACQEVDKVFATLREAKLSKIAVSLVIKYLFSCLIDADRSNTRQFEENRYESWQEGSHHDFFATSYDRLIRVLQSYDASESAAHPINQLRRDMSLQCEEFASRPTGIYTLSIPTGGGKTLASLRYALRHALTHNKERIVFVVPFTTVIEQNADEVRRILQEHDLILEHHSNVLIDFDDTSDYDVRKKQAAMARDNWDRPIIFTTMVQFLNTFFAKGTRNVRRLHRLSNAVLIFDEVQSVPPKCVSLFNAALNFLRAVGGSTSILCTATKPTLDFVKERLHLELEAEMIQNLGDVSRQFKRVDIVDRTGSPLGVEELTELVRDVMVDQKQVLVILNTKSAVKKLFLRLQQDPLVTECKVSLFHLSTNMCAAHRKDVLSRVRCLLAKKEPVICVSTQLIEAGVDISFDCVIRSLAGLDSIAQAAGRCNRHGLDPVKKVYVIQSADEVLDNLPEIRIGADVARRVLSEFARQPDSYGNDLLSPQALELYFKYYFFQISGDLKYPIPKLGSNLFDLLDRNADLSSAYKNKHGKWPEVETRASLATAERYFEVIQNNSTSILVPYNAEAKEILIQLNGAVAPDDLSVLLRRSQQFVVNVYDHTLRALDRVGAVYQLLHGQVFALRENAYTADFGVEPQGNAIWQFEMSD